MKVRCFDISWDTDGKNLGLPSEMTVDLDDDIIALGYGCEIYDRLADALQEASGYGALDFKNDCEKPCPPKEPKYVFTVTDGDSCDKQIVYAKTVGRDVVNDQKRAEALINWWCHFNVPKEDYSGELEDTAYCMRKNGYSWIAERWCFELTELVA